MQLRTLFTRLSDKVAKKVDFHSTIILTFNFFDKDQTNINQHHSNPVSSLNKVAKLLEFPLGLFSGKRSSERSEWSSKVTKF